MKKVVYSVTKYVGDKFTKLSGIGCITDEDLVIACNNKENAGVDFSLSTSAIFIIGK